VDDDELVPLPQAARLLGTTSESLRRRLQRGLTIHGEKRDGAWHVRRADVEREISHGAPSAIDAQSRVETALERELALTREMLETERRRADRLDQLLAEERQASAELRRLLARVLGGEPDKPDT
jgi:hypothetical protein